MLKQNNLPKSLWGEAINNVVYILSRCPTKKQKNNVPEEVWSGKRPSVSHLNVFGSICYKHVSHARRKFEDKSEPMILVGYHITIAYQVHVFLNNRLVISIYGSFD